MGMDDLSSDPLFTLLQDRSKSFTERVDSLLALVKSNEAIPPEQLVATLGQLLDDETESIDIRCSAALCLGRVGNEAAFSRLSQKVTDKSAVLRNYVMQALGQSKRLEAAPLLVEALKDSDNGVFATAAEALGQLGSPVVPVLCDLLREGADDAQCVAAWQLGELQNRKAVEALVEQTSKSKNKDVQALCIWALGEIGVHSEEVMQLIHWAKQHEDPEIRLRGQTASKKIVRHVN